MTGLSRRKFLYTGAGVAAVAGAGYLTKDYWMPMLEDLRPQTTRPATTTPTTEEATSNPPYADFRLKKPRYIQPCVGQEVQFENVSTDPDGDPLTYQWYVDDQLVSESKDLVTSFLEQGKHGVGLVVSDGKLKDETGTYLNVVSDQIYPTKALNLRYKGTSYYIGSVGEWSSPSPTEEQMDEYLDVIHDELGCNAIIITAGGEFEDLIIQCGEMAIKKGFERIYIQPQFMNASPDVTVEEIGKFAPRVKRLTEISRAVVYNVGHEFSLETAIASGSTWNQRLESHVGEWGKVKATLYKMFMAIIQVCKENYGYPISYSSTMYETWDNAVPWYDRAFESIGVDAYLQEVTGNTENWYMDLFSKLRTHGKPIYSTEWGSMAYTGAGKYGGMALHPKYWSGKTYDEDEQAKNIERHLKLYNVAKIDGCFYATFNDPANIMGPESIFYGLLDHRRRRKKGFYMYKSYQRAGS